MPADRDARGRFKTDHCAYVSVFSSPAIAVNHSSPTSAGAGILEDHASPQYGGAVSGNYHFPDTRNRTCKRHCRELMCCVGCVTDVIIGDIRIPA